MVVSPVEMTRSNRLIVLVAGSLAMAAIGCAPNARLEEAPEHAGTDGGGSTVPVSAETYQGSDTPVSEGFGRATPGWAGDKAPSESGSLGGMRGADKAPKPTHKGGDGHGVVDHGTDHGSSGVDSSDH